jgi:hypothetical protein
MVGEKDQRPEIEKNLSLTAEIFLNSKGSNIHINDYHI